MPRHGEGRLIFHVFGSIAEFERERIVERTHEGLVAARKRGRVGGRPPARSEDQRKEVRRMRDNDRRSIGDIARLFKVQTRHSSIPNRTRADGHLEPR